MAYCGRLFDTVSYVFWALSRNKSSIELPALKFAPEGPAIGGGAPLRPAGTGGREHLLAEVVEPAGKGRSSPAGRRRKTAPLDGSNRTRADGQRYQHRLAGRQASGGGQRVLGIPGFELRFDGATIGCDSERGHQSVGVNAGRLAWVGGAERH